jgi:hypothetical protein
MGTSTKNRVFRALVGGDSRLIEAHDRAVSKAVSELERHAEARVHGGRDVVTTGNVIAASFRHETSRALDPQLHSHCVVLNITRRAGGEWRAIDARGIFRAQRLGNETLPGRASEGAFGARLRGRELQGRPRARSGSSFRSGRRSVSRRLGASTRRASRRHRAVHLLQERTIEDAHRPKRNHDDLHLRRRGASHRERLRRHSSDAVMERRLQ